MRLASLAAATALCAGVVTHATPALAEPSPTCAAEFVAGAATVHNGLVSTAIVGAATVVVTCQLPVLDTTPATYLAGWSGDLELSVELGDGTQFSGCTGGLTGVPAVASVLVMTYAQPCTIPATDPSYGAPLVAVARWSVSGPDWYRSETAYGDFPVLP